LACYQALYAHWPTSAVALHAAVAVSHAIGPAEGLSALEQLHARRAFRAGVSFYRAKAEMLMRLGKRKAAREAWVEASQCPQLTVAKRRHIEHRLALLGG